MFDCYHLQMMGGDLTHQLQDLMPIIGHVQFAAVPDRGTAATRTRRGRWFHQPDRRETLARVALPPPRGTGFMPVPFFLAGTGSHFATGRGFLSLLLLQLRPLVPQSHPAHASHALIVEFLEFVQKILSHGPALRPVQQD